MYILSGKLKGKKLANCKSKSIRPAMALVRKSIFDSLNDLAENSSVLDLCAGSGSLGIEALSRGAKDLVLVDSDLSSIKIIRKNLKTCDLEATVITGIVPEVLKRKYFKDKSYNLIFLDPPYARAKFIDKTICLICKNNLIKKDGIISIETQRKYTFDLPEGCHIVREKNYGNTKVTFLSNTNIA